MAETRTRLSPGGRVVIPAEYRRALQLRTGDELIVRLEDGELRIFTPRQAIREAQELIRRYVSKERSLAGELISERRAESGRE